MRHSGFSRPKSMVGQLTHDLSEAIVKGTLSPGRRITESELENWFGVSRAPIREALRLLQGDGLIEVDDYKRKYVRRITKKNLAEVFPIIACLEGLAARLAAPVINGDQIRTLIDLNERMRHAYFEAGYEQCSHLNHEFHRVYIKAVDSEILNRTIKSLTNGISWLLLTNICYADSETIPVSIEEHEGIIEAFEAKDAERAEQTVRAHLTRVYQWLLRYSTFDAKGDYIMDQQLAE